MLRHFTVIGKGAFAGALVAALGGCTSPQANRDDLEGDPQTLLISGVTFQSVLEKRFVGAENNGGGAVNATATVAQAWERFILDDVNGGTLDSGDRVHIRAGNGQYFQAVNGGGSTLNAASSNTLGWETFTVVKTSGVGTIQNGDVIGIQSSSGNWVSAQGGGGAGVFAYGGALGAWEQFAIGGLGSPVPPVGPILPVTVTGVSFRTTLQGRYVGAENNGGGAVIATAASPLAWETFSLVDLNGDTLQSGDAVNIRAGGGQYFQALNGGGSTLSAVGVIAGTNGTFKIVKQNGAGAIQSGDTVGLQATSGNWVSAENGGGAAVFAYGGALGPWESFALGIGTPPAAPSDGQLVWSDEFDGTGVDPSKWSFEVQRPGWVNHESQNYTARPENARIENGTLVIEARRDWFDGFEYSSARIKTQGKVSWTYGRFEARIKLPGGWGTWPAFWMIADNFSRGWPACGEIDIMEEVGFDANTVHATTHSLAYNWVNGRQRTATTGVGGATTDYHVYAAEWSPDRIDFLVDGRKYFTSPNDNSGDDAWPFNKNFHIILNLAVGGDWGAAQGVDPSGWPRQMFVDYVRVYRR